MERIRVSEVSDSRTVRHPRFKFQSSLLAIAILHQNRKLETLVNGKALFEVHFLL